MMLNQEILLLIINQFIKQQLNSLRKEISMVSQETTLFDDTIKNNIKYAKEDATDEEILKLQNYHFVMNLLINYQ